MCVFFNVIHLTDAIYKPHLAQSLVQSFFFAAEAQLHPTNIGSLSRNADLVTQQSRETHGKPIAVPSSDPNPPCSWP